MWLGDEEESYNQEQYNITLDQDAWDAETPGEEEDDQEEYSMEHDEVELNQTVATDSDDQDEDDQGNYNWHKGSPRLPILDVFISAARVTSSDDKEEPSYSLIQPGRKAICNAYAQLIIDRDKYSIKVAKAKLDSCGLYQ